MSIADIVGSALEKGQPIIQQWGLIAICGGILCETLFCAGVFIPGFSILVAAGFLSAQGGLSPWGVLAAAILGGVLGGQTAFLIGRLTGERFLKRRYKLVRRLREAVQREGSSVLLWYHHVSPMRAVMPYLAGSMGYPWRNWLLFDTLGLMLWVGFAFGLGYFAYGPLSKYGNAGTLIVLALVAGMIIFTSWRLTRMFRSVKESDAPGEQAGTGPASTAGA
jgi:membrane protein DedA with SNARE-associated domain